MASNQKQFRPVRLQRPWDQPGYRDSELVIQQIVDEIRQLEKTKIANLTHWDVLEDAASGDLLIESHTGPTVRLRIAASGLVSVSGDAVISGNETVKGALIVSGDATVSGAASVSGAANIGASLTASGATLLKSTLEASGAATLDSTLLVKSTAEVSGAATLDSTLLVKGTAEVSGAATLDSTLLVKGTAEVSGNATMDAALTVKGALSVSGAATISGNATVSGDFAHAGSHWGEFGHAPAVRPAAYTVSNSTPIRSIDVATVTLTQLANLVASIIADFQGRGTFQ